MGVTVFLPQPWGMLFASWSGHLCHKVLTTPLAHL